MRRAVRTTGLMAGAVLVLLAEGCGGFFPPLTTTTTTTPPTTTADFVYVANVVGSSVAGFSVATSATGVATLASLGSALTLPLVPTAMTITPANTFLYVAGVGGIYGYSINSTNGTLTALNGGGVEAITNVESVSMDVSPDGQWLFALSRDGQTLFEYTVNATTGGLTLLADPTYLPAASAPVVPTMVRVAPNGTFVALALGTGGDVVWPLITSTGALAKIYQQLPTGSLTTSDNAVAIDGTATYLYVARSGTSTGVAVYGFNTNGTLTSVAGSPFAARAGPFAVLLDATGKYLYTANRSDNNISEFLIGAGGVLTAIAGPPVASGSLVTSLARDSSGKYVLAAASGGSPDLTMYGFDATTPGKLDSVATATTGTDPVDAVLVVATH